MSTENTQVRNENIDTLRAVAIILVMIVHFPRLRQIIPILNPWSGVDLFFAISGFVVAKSFVPQLDAALNSTTSQTGKSLVAARHIKAFFVRRFMRIMPALIFALTFYLIAGFSVGETNLISASNLGSEIFSIFTYTANFFAAYRSSTVLTWHWSLAAEEQFYFLFPIFILLIKSARNRTVSALGVLGFISFVFRPYGSTWFGDPPAAMYLPQFRNDGLGYGFLVYLLSEQHWFPEVRPRIFTESWALRFLSFGILISIVALAPQLAFSYNFAVPTIGIASAILVTLALWSNTGFIPFKPIKAVLQWIGLRSYGLYLFHIPVVRIVQQIEANFMKEYGVVSYPVHFLILMFCLCGIVEFSFRVIETPLVRRGKKWSKAIIEQP
jgi:peptidoglycan/LPS O-acetylase OafA/YrhL